MGRWQIDEFSRAFSLPPWREICFALFFEFHLLRFHDRQNAGQSCQATAKIVRRQSTMDKSVMASRATERQRCTECLKLTGKVFSRGKTERRRATLGFEAAILSFLDILEKRDYIEKVAPSRLSIVQKGRRVAFGDATVIALDTRGVRRPRNPETRETPSTRTREF